MKVIDLLVKIANGEEVPKKIKYANCIYYLDDEWIDVCYRREDNKRIFEEFFVFENLNDEIEIIEDTPKEDKKIEKLDYCEENTFMKQKETTYLSQNERLLLDSNFKELGKKINEIIDKINVEK